jgi:GT2 family glycosyltransferase
MLIDYLYSYYNPTSNRPSFFASNNFALPTERFHQLGGFDTTFPLAAGEDREFCYRWQHHGYPMVYSPEVQIHHVHSLKLRTFWQQHFNYGRGAYYFRRACTLRNQGRIRVEPLSFYCKLLAYPLLHSVPQLAAILLATLLFVSQVANAAGFFWERLKRLACDGKVVMGHITFRSSRTL